MNLRIADESDFPILNLILENADDKRKYTSIFFNQFNLKGLEVRNIISKRRIRGIIFSEDLDWIIIEKNMSHSLLVIQYPSALVQTSAITISLGVFNHRIGKIDLSNLFNLVNNDITKISIRADTVGRRALEKFLLCSKEAEISNISKPVFYYAVLKGERYL